MPGEAQSMEPGGCITPNGNNFYCWGREWPDLSYGAGLFSNSHGAEGRTEPYFGRKLEFKLLRKNHSQKEAGSVKIEVETHLHFIKNVGKKDKKK